MDEVNPCAIISVLAPEKLHVVWISPAEITKPMWLTDEYAINDFRSVCRRQIELVMIRPQRLKIIKG